MCGLGGVDRGSVVDRLPRDPVKFNRLARSKLFANRADGAAEQSLPISSLYGKSEIGQNDKPPGTDPNSIEEIDFIDVECRVQPGISDILPGRFLTLANTTSVKACADSMLLVGIAVWVWIAAFTATRRR